MNDGRPTRVTSSPLTAPIMSPIRITTPAASQGSMPSRSSWNDIRIKQEAVVRADRQVELAGDEQIGHADREDAEDRGAPGDIDQIVLAQETRAGQREQHKQHQRDDQDGDVAIAQQTAQHS